jgi:DNA-binding PucR family transcriptional regulator
VRPGGDPAERIRSGGPLPVGVRAAVGPTADGLDGFRWSHGAAQEAARLAGLGPGGVVGHGEAAVAGLLTANAEHARRFALDTLGPQLCAGSTKARRLRETLAAYLAVGRSRAASAEQLHVSPGTVAYRVKQAEDLLGETVEGSGWMLMIALEIMRAFEPVGRDPAAVAGDGPLAAMGCELRILSAKGGDR